MEISIDALRQGNLSARQKSLLISLLALNFIFYIAGLLWPASRESMMLHSPALPAPPLITAIRNWRALGSYSLVHSGLTHLLFNMCFLWIIGRNLILHQGGRRMLICYLGGALAGALGFLTATAFIPEGHATSLCGASAAILSICGAVVATGHADIIKAIAWAAIIAGIIANLSPESLATHIPGLFTGIIIAKSIFKE